jgi:photosystem II stability/assembly factor-like uncharacterized protein
VAIAVAGLVVAACGSSHKSLADLIDPAGVPPTTTEAPVDTATATTIGVPTTAPSTTATPAPAASSGQWTAVTGNLAGMQSECGNLSLVSTRPDRDTVIASVAQHGLWSSSGTSTTWSALGQGPGSAVITNRASAIVYDPQHPNTFWESGIYNGGGVYRTDDNGATFKQLGTIQHADAVSVDLNDPAHQTLLVGRHETSQLWRSTDGGQTWVDISSSLPAGVGFVTNPLVLDAKTFVLGTNHGTNSGIFRSTDGGNTWTQVRKGAVAGPALVTKSDGSLYWMTEPGGGILRSVDGGATWTQVARDGTASPNAANIVELPNGRLATVGNQVILTSADKGATWQRLGVPTPFPPEGLVYSASNNVLYIWYSDCDHEQPVDPIKADNIMRLDLSKA